MKAFAMIAALAIPMLVSTAWGQSAPASFAYILQADSFAETKAAAVGKLKSCDRDWVVLDAVFNSETPWMREDLDGSRGGKKDRKMIAYISIGEAEEYRRYWLKEWGGKGKLSAVAPSWLGVENPEWKGNYRVKYWQPEWQKLMLAAIDAAMACGFDGVYLDIVDGFQTFEQVGKTYLDDRPNPETKQSYRRDMVDWVKAIAVRARAKNPAALVIPQNGSELLVHADFVAAISAIGIEDLFTEGNRLQTKSHTQAVSGHLKKPDAVKKPVLLVEYPTTGERQALSKKLAKENGMIWLVTDRQLKTIGESGR